MSTINSNTQSILNSYRSEHLASLEKDKQQELLKQQQEKDNEISTDSLIEELKPYWEAQVMIKEECGIDKHHDTKCPVCLNSIPKHIIKESPPEPQEFMKVFNSISCKFCKKIYHSRHNHIYELISKILSQKNEKERVEKESRKKIEHEEWKNRFSESLITFNQNVKKMIENRKAVSNFEDVTFENRVTNNTFILKAEGSDVWEHYEISGNKYSNSTSGMSNNWIHHYEEGKVPFMTKCPVCAFPTKINYVHEHNGYGQIAKPYFSEVCCDGHYKYDSKTGKHYKWGQHVPRPALFDKYGNNMNTCLPQNHGNQWIEFYPNDSYVCKKDDNTKRIDIEKIEKQIKELQEKLNSLKN